MVGGGAQGERGTGTMRGMEALFATDFSSVQVHGDRQVGATASAGYTVGEQIFLSPGRFPPSTAQDRHVLAHELAHVVQQRAGRAPSAQEGLAGLRSHLSLEREAERAADFADAGARPDMVGLGAPPRTVATDPLPQHFIQVLAGALPFVVPFLERWAIRAVGYLALDYLTEKAFEALREHLKELIDSIPEVERIRAEITDVQRAMEMARMVHLAKEPAGAIMTATLRPAFKRLFDWLGIRTDEIQWDVAVARAVTGTAFGLMEYHFFVRHINDVKATLQATVEGVRDQLPVVELGNIHEQAERFDYWYGWYRAIKGDPRFKEHATEAAELITDVQGKLDEAKRVLESQRATSRALATGLGALTSGLVEGGLAAYSTPGGAKEKAKAATASGSAGVGGYLTGRAIESLIDLALEGRVENQYVLIPVKVVSSTLGALVARKYVRVAVEKLWELIDPPASGALAPPQGAGGSGEHGGGPSPSTGAPRHQDDGPREETRPADLPDDGPTTSRLSESTMARVIRAQARGDERFGVIVPMNGLLQGVLASPLGPQFAARLTGRPPGLFFPTPLRLTPPPVQTPSGGGSGPRTEAATSGASDAHEAIEKMLATISSEGSAMEGVD
jgi:hypothetical protein